MSDVPPPPPQNPYAVNTQLSPADEKLWSTLVHVGGIFFNFIPALIGYLILKDRGPFVREHTATALNFQLTVLIAYIICYILFFILIGGLLLLAVSIVNIVFCILAAIAASRGQRYVYPLAIRFVK
jgi:uncharacterized Tic20 family protein